MNILIFQTLGTVYSDAAPGSKLQPGLSAQSAAADAMPQTSEPALAVSKSMAIQVKPTGPIFCAVCQITWAKFWPMRKDMTYDHQAITWTNIDSEVLTQGQINRKFSRYLTSIWVLKLPISDYRTWN